MRKKHSDIDTISEKKTVSTKLQTRRVEEVEEEIEFSQDETTKKSKSKPLDEVEENISEVESSKKKKQEETQ